MKSFAFDVNGNFEKQIEDIFEMMSILYKIPGKKIGRAIIKKINAGIEKMKQNEDLN